MPGLNSISARYTLGTWYDSRFDFEFRWSTQYLPNTREYAMTMEASGEGFSYANTFLTREEYRVGDDSTWLNEMIPVVREGLIKAIDRHGKVEPVENTAGVLKHLARMGRAVLA